MTTYNVTNGPATIIGGAGSDTLNVTYNIDGGVDMNSFTGSLATGYSGWFDGPGGANIEFSGIENFSFTNLGSGPDRMVTGDGADTLSSGDGDDVLNSGGGIDVVDGGTGNDTWIADKSFATDAIAINLAAGVAQTYLGTGSVVNIEAFNLTTGSGNDTIQGTTAVLADYIDTGGGDDTIILPESANDTVAGGTGTDTLVVVQALDGGVDTVSFTADASGYSGWLDGPGANNLNFSGIENFNFTDTGSGPDRIVTGDGDDTINGGAGDDDLNSGRGSDVIDGGDGLDTWEADTSFSDTAVKINLAKPGAQTYFGGGSVINVEAFHLVTGGGDDRLGGTTAVLADYIDAGGGDDIITLPESSNDTVLGGAGSDTLVVVQALDGGVNTVSFAADASGYSGWLDGPGSNNLTFSGIDRFKFTDTGVGPDNITTGDGADTINGGAGDDVLNSGRGADVINGSIGLDYWIADRSNVSENIKIDLTTTTAQKVAGGGSIAGIEGMSLICGSGDDQIRTSNAVMNDSITAGDGNDTLTIGLHGVDTVDGGAGRDRLVVSYGSGAVDLIINAHDASGYTGRFDGPGGNDINFSHIEDFSITGSDGADNLGGLVGNDYLNGAGGADTLFGGDGADTLLGGAGKDRLSGGAGRDLLTGGGDADIFVYGSVTDSQNSSLHDIIQDFSGKDRIDLSAIDADSGAGGDQAFSFIGSAGFHGVAGELRAKVSGGSTFVYGDVNGDGVADFAIELTGAQTLHAGDFVL